MVILELPFKSPVKRGQNNKCIWNTVGLLEGTGRHIHSTPEGQEKDNSSKEKPKPVRDTSLNWTKLMVLMGQSRCMLKEGQQLDILCSWGHFSYNLHNCPKMDELFKSGWVVQIEELQRLTRRKRQLVKFFSLFY